MKHKISRIGLLAVVPLLMTTIVLYNIDEAYAYERGDTLEETKDAFVETEVTIPNEASDPSCAESGSCFLPGEVTIGVGESVTWHNDSGVIHTVTSGSFEDGPDGVFDSSIVMAGDTFTHTFTETGQYEYFCSIHPWMTGTVIVV